ncbi:MAG: hypothetical protein WC381_07010 [Kiritimatiellia bacterium]|jgi:hypothetical protein
MKNIYKNLVLTRTGDADAEAALFSLPLPRGKGGRLAPAHPCAGMAPLAWWKRDVEPRRMLTTLSAPEGKRLPKTLKLKSARPAKVPAEPSPWTLSTPLTTERIPYVAHNFPDIDGLRGVPAADCSTLEYALDLAYGGRTLRFQPGATGPGQAECLWQNVQIDRLWRNAAAEALRVGGIIYNEDTYLWADLYLILFANGVVSATLHFTNTKLHIKGYDFRGFPYLKIMGAGLKGVEADMPRDGWRHDLGAAAFNFADTAITCGEANPARLREKAGAVYYTPFARIVNPQKPEGPSDLWEPGFARTIRFQFSLSKAAPAVARYVVPAWWYGVCGEPWPGGLLPVSGRFTPVSVAAGDYVRGGMCRGAFDGGSVGALGGAGNDGGAGAGLMQQAYLTGDPGLYRDALDYCAYWADLAVDHTDFTVHQWLGGWGWKTCAYNKFRDVLFAWLETGDPWMRDTLEMTAEAYWVWFRANWPRNAIGRDAFEVSGWALLWRYLRTEHAHDRLRELARMIGAVLESRGSVGGQMGAGPHPGWHASLYMTGVAMVSMVEALEAEEEAGEKTDAFVAPLKTLHDHYIRDDVELFPISLGKSSRANFSIGQNLTWSLFGLHIYAGMGRCFGFEHPAVREGFAKLLPCLNFDIKEWSGRAGDNHLHPRAHDAFMLAARMAEDGQGVDLAPAFGAATLPWPAMQIVETPWGALSIAAAETKDGVILTLAAPADFRVRIRTGGETVETNSRGETRIPLNT